MIKDNTELQFSEVVSRMRENLWYDWLSVFDFGLRTLDRLRRDDSPYTEWFERHMNKVWERRSELFEEWLNDQ